MEGKVVAIVLAAGSSRRMGRIKQLLPLRGRPMLQHVLDSAANAALLDRVILLLGHYGCEIRKCLDLKGADLYWVPDPGLGQSSSLRRGVEEAERLGASAVMFLLGDQPLVTPEVLDRVARAYREYRDPVVMPACQGKRGNPVLMDQALFPRLRHIRGDIGGRAIMSRYEGMIREVEVSCPGIHVDVDEWRDYIRLLQEG